jgi:large subunit ribosomal protein L18
MKPTKIRHRLARKRRIRTKVHGTAERPRLAIYCSLTRITAQIIDDVAGKTIAFAGTSKGKNVKEAAALGKSIAAKAKDANVTSVVFDRAGRKYHGRIKALADAAREGGLQF